MRKRAQAKTRTTQLSADSERAQAYKVKFEELIKPANLALILYRDRKLDRAGIDAKVIELTYHAVLRKLACDALNGNTKAQDLFLKRADSYYSSKRSVEVIKGEPVKAPPRRDGADDEPTER